INRIAEAVYPIIDTWDLPQFEYLRSLYHESEANGHAPFSNGLAWVYRNGQSWQADIEAHVAAYRANPRPFATDLGLCMEPGGLWDRLRDRLTGESTTRLDISLQQS